jgi:hypothetical protein
MSHLVIGCCDRNMSILEGFCVNRFDRYWREIVYYLLAEISRFDLIETYYCCYSVELNKSTTNSGSRKRP